jgi:hypothetical protein
VHGLLLQPLPNCSRVIFRLFETVKDEIQATSVSKEPLWPRTQCTWRSKDRGSNRDARMLSSTSGSVDKALSRGPL